MYGGPGFTKPAHQFGQSFGDQAEVLDGGEGLPKASAEAKGNAAAPSPDELPPRDAFEEAAAEERLANWAGKGFDIPYREPE